MNPVIDPNYIEYWNERQGTGAMTGQLRRIRTQDLPIDSREQTAVYGAQNCLLTGRGLTDLSILNNYSANGVKWGMTIKHSYQRVGLY